MGNHVVPSYCELKTLHTQVSKKANLWMLVKFFWKNLLNLVGHKHLPSRGRLTRSTHFTIHMPQRTSKISLVRLTANRNALLFLGKNANESAFE